MGSLIQEAKRVKEIRRSTVYAIVLGLLFQVVDVVKPNINASQWIIQTAILVYILRLPIVMARLLSSMEDFLAYIAIQ